MGCGERSDDFDFFPRNKPLPERSFANTFKWKLSEEIVVEYCHLPDGEWV